MSDLSSRLREILGRPFKEADRVYIRKAADEIDRLKEVKRRAVDLANERAKEANALRQQLVKARKALEEIELFPYVGAKACVEMQHIARAALTDEKST